MSAATATADDARIPLRGHLRHTGALVRRNLLWIKQDPESMFDALLMPVVFTLLFVYVFGGSIGQALGGPVAHDLWVTLAWSVGITALAAPYAIHKFRTKT